MEIKNISFMLVAVGMFFAACSDNDNVTVSTYSGEVPIFTLSPSFSLYTESENTYMVLSEDGAYAGLSVDLSVNGEIYHLFGTRDIAVKPLLEGGLLSDRWPCRYSFLTQSSDWIECDYDVSTWGKGNGPFGCGHDIATPWSSKNLYIRRDFEWNETDFSGNLFLDYCIKGEAEVYLNGDFLIKLKGNGKLQRIELPATTAMFMYKGTNVLAVKCINHSMSADAISDFGIVMSADEHIEDADLTGISCNADVSRLEYHCGTVKAELSFIAPKADYGCYPVNYLRCRVLSEMKPDESYVFEVKSDLSHLFDSFRYASEDVVSCSNEGSALYSAPVGMSCWGELNLGAASGIFDVSVEDGVVAMRSEIKGNKSGKDGVILYAGYNEEYAFQLFGNNVRPAWNPKGDRNITDLVRKDMLRPDKIVKSNESAGPELRRLKARLRAGVNESADLVYMTSWFLNRMTMISGIADTLARYGEWKLLEGLMNPILMYAESGRWNAPFCPPDVGAYPYAMHRITEDMDYEWITQKALDIVADIDSLAGNADYSDKYEKTLDKWRNYIKQ